MAEGFLELAQEAAKVLPLGEQERLAEEMRKALQAEKATRADRVRRRREFVAWIERESPLTEEGAKLLRDIHQEFKEGFAFPSDLKETDE
jgi:hypothetical protein